ncbi:e1.1 [Tranosema rostrale ichnovirus]|nr:e1.1 [Tranosema rostrale ichnovirus]
MLHVLSSLQGLLKVQTTFIDSKIFRLHYKLTVIILLAFSLLITSGQFFGDPIDCDFPDWTGSSPNAYCYSHSTFLVERSLSSKPGTRWPYPGVSEHTEEDKLKYYSYYQWVFIALFIQAISFYIPHYIWKSWEGGRMKMLTVALDSPVLSEKSIDENMEPLVEYFCTQLHSQNSYVYKYYTCELLSFINIVGQIYFMNAFIGEDFQYYGIYLIIFQQHLNGRMTNPMEKVFPTMTKCSYEKFGPSGTVEKRDGLCVLTQNTVNAKIYVFLWFWFHILAIISALMIIWRIMTLIFPSIRFYSFRSSCSMNRDKDIDAVFHKLRIGDWFMLRMLQRNLNLLAYKQLIFRIAQRFNSGVFNV